MDKPNLLKIKSKNSEITLIHMVEGGVAIGIKNPCTNEATYNIYLSERNKKRIQKFLNQGELPE